MNECKECKREYEYDRKKGHTRKVCNSCMSNRQRFGVKEKAIEYKGGKCERCGYNRCIRALVFHHLDATKKSFGISGNHGRKWEMLIKELDKCILLCSNCHMEEHDK